MQLMMLEGDAGLYTSLVSAFGRAGSCDDVLSTAAMVEGKGVADRGRIYSAAVSSLLEGNRTAEAVDLYRRSLDDGAVYSKDGYVAAIRGAGHSREPALSAFFLSELKSRLPERCVMRSSSSGSKAGSGGWTLSWLMLLTGMAHAADWLAAVRPWSRPVCCGSPSRPAAGRGRWRRPPRSCSSTTATVRGGRGM